MPLNQDFQGGSRESKAQLERRWWPGLALLEGQEAGTESNPLPRFPARMEVVITYFAIVTPTPTQVPSLPAPPQCTLTSLPWGPPVRSTWYWKRR